VLDGLRAWAAAEADRRPELEALGYFGSYARGDEGFGSDLDLVAVVAHSSLPFTERARDWKTETLPVPADLLVYTAEEWEAVRDGAGRFASVLETETVWLARDPAATERSEPDMITRGIHAFMARDWQRARDAKDAYWAERVRRLGPLEALRIADELRRQALLQHPDWPDAASRRDDLRHHVRMTELFARVDAARRA
ncbi:MAG: nucleotidyltransferase domain-containing protein, partial [Chloroflexi bacterium]|nr:nucleotidyltransferase domain-containing protein [Chloroflexota bacterium]